MKLWTVRVVREAYVLAETEEEAQEFAREIERWESPEIIVGDGDEDLGWQDDCFIYHDGRENITLRMARQNQTAQPQPSDEA